MADQKDEKALGGMSAEEKEILANQPDGVNAVDEAGNLISQGVGKPSLEDEEGKPEDKPEDKKEPTSDDKMPDLVLKRSEAPKTPDGVDLEALTQEFIENGGSLTPESYKKTTAAFKKVGVGSDMVDTYLIGLQAQAVQSQSVAHEAAGGKEGYAAMAKWAGENLSDADLEAYNAATAQGPAAMRMAVESVNARFLAASGRTPTHDYSGGGNAASTKGGGGLEVQSRHELQAIVGTPEYKANTPAGARYREQVHAALARSMKKGYSQLD